MAKKKEEQGQPPEDQAAEQRVREMMEPEPAVADVGSDPSVKKAISIKVTHHDDENKDEDKAEVEAAIEEANKQLEAATAPELKSSKGHPKIVPIKEDEPEPEEPVDTPADEETPEVAEEADEPEESTEKAQAEEITEKDADEEVEPEDEKPAETDTEVPVETVAEEPIPAIESDPEVDKAVEEIQAEEGDKLLEAEDTERELTNNQALVAAALKKPGFKEKLLDFIKKPAVRWTVCLIILIGLASAATVPNSRYFLLNTAGVRSSTSLKVLDESTSQPLRNVRVSIGEASGITDGEGNAALGNVRLGNNEIVIERRAFAKLTKRHTFGWGSNPLGDYKLRPTGTQYAFKVSDYLSDKPVAKAEASSGDINAISDDEGVIKLTTDDKEVEKLSVTIKSEGYRDEVLVFDANDMSERSVKLVPVRKHTFVSNRNGKLDVYKIDVDGKNEERILAGTGTEREDMVLASHPSQEVVAVVSTRENKRNKDGFLLSTLTIIDLKNNEQHSVTTSERVQVVDWIGNRLVYVAVAEGQSGNSPNRHRLMSYEFKTKDNKQLAASNYFNDVLVASGKLYYAPSSVYQQGGDIGLYRVDADGANKQTIIAKETWNIFRTSTTRLVMALPNGWYEYRIGDATPVKLEGAPASQISRVYIDSPDGKRSLWVDSRDGKGVLLYYDNTAKNDVTVRTQSGLKNPIRWVKDNVVIYRIKTDQESADYVLNLDGGEPKKLKDVTDVGGIDKWYYY